MKRKMAMLVMALAVGTLSVPATFAAAAPVADEYDEDDDDYWDDDEDEDDWWAGELTAGDLRVTPAKKTLQVGKSFTLNIIAASDSEYEDLSDEEWDELCENNIDNISFRSTKSSVAYVNQETGKVKARKKGSCIIKTTIDLANGESVTYKTKVYVTR
jgi:hypothetical protein